MRTSSVDRVQATGYKLRGAFAPRMRTEPQLAQAIKSDGRRRLVVACAVRGAALTRASLALTREPYQKL